MQSGVLFVCCLSRLYTSLSSDQFIGLLYQTTRTCSNYSVYSLINITLHSYFNCSSHSELECRGRFADSRWATSSSLSSSGRSKFRPGPATVVIGTLRWCGAVVARCSCSRSHRCRSRSRVDTPVARGLSPPNPIPPPNPPPNPPPIPPP